MRPRILLLLALLGLLGLISATLRRQELRTELIEQIKDGSDALLNAGLRATSQFGSELTAEREAEQPAFRQRRLRDLS